MTCREKLKKDDTGCVGNEWIGGCCGCPHDYGYLDRPEYCDDEGNDVLCGKCWDREIPETDDEKPRILDSGERRQFDTGAVRDIQEGKGRCDLMPLDVVADYLSNKIIRLIGEFQRSGEADWLYMVLGNLEWDDPYSIILEVAKHFEAGAKKYGEHNWQKGIPVKCYIDSAVRHYLKYLRGDTDEPHDRAFVWNIMCCIWTCKHKPELNDYMKEKEHD